MKISVWQILQRNEDHRSLKKIGEYLKKIKIFKKQGKNKIKKKIKTNKKNKNKK